MYIIYAHVNKINGKRYIGITMRNPIYRWGKDGNGYKNQPKFFKAIQKYGWDNFEHIILDYCETEEEALKKESEYIKQYNCIDNGYNILEEGIQSYPRYRPVFCLTTNTLYNSITEAAEKNDICSASAIIENCKGQSSHVKGLEWAYWDEENQKPYTKPQFIKKKPSNSVKVYCIELDKEFLTMAEAERELNITPGGVKKAISGIRNGANGYHFIRLEEKTPEKIKEIMKKKTGKFRKIICLDNQQIFDSLQEAGDFCKRSAQSVMLNCQGKRKTCGGYRFKYYEDYIEGE